MLEYVVPFEQPILSIPESHEQISRTELPRIPRAKLQILVSLIRASMLGMTASHCLLYANERSICNFLRDFLCKDTSLAFSPNTSNAKVMVEVLPEDPSTAAMFLRHKEDQVRIIIVPRDAEDFDIPQARVVIRFDICVDPLSYAWSCAVVRDGGLMCHVVEAGNDIDSKALSQTCQVMGKPMLRAWCRTLQSPDGLSYPPAALGSRSRFPQVLYHDNEVIEDPVTGGIIGCSDAVGVILAFASNFADKPPTRPLLSYNHTPQGVYMCTVHLTDVISDDVVASSGHSQAHARRVACFKACQILQTQGALDSTYFRSILDTVSESSVPAVTNNKYHRKAPRFWDRCIASPANRLHPTLVHLEATSGATAAIPTGAKGVDIFILTTQRLPSLFPFNVYRTGSTTSSLDISRVSSTQGASFSVSDSQLKQLHHYTLKVTRLITNRRFVCSLDQMSYFIAPCKPFRRAEVGRAHSTIHEDIDWQQVLQSLETWISALTLEDVNHESRILDYVVQERAVEFTQHFFVKTVRRDLTPLSKPVEHSRESDFSSYLDAARAHSQYAEKVTETHQPLIEIEMAPVLLNALTPAKQSMPSPSKAARFLIPQLCYKLGISARVFSALTFVPAIMEHISLQLLATELNASLMVSSIDTQYLFSALIGRSSLMDTDYERLEFFGDAYLKYIVGLYVFMTNPFQSENGLDLKRREIVSNKALKACGERVGVAPYIHLRAFATKSWRPLHYEIASDPPKEHTKASPIRDELLLDLARQEELVAANSCIPSKDTRQDSPSHHVADKILADVIEALLGAAYVSSGPKGASRMMHALRIPLSHLDRFQDLVVRAQTIMNTGVINLRSEVFHAVSRIIGYPIASPRLFERAITFGLNEQLEFVGDAILDFLVCQYIYRRYPSQSPGVLTMLKNAMTSNITLSAIAVHLGLHRQISGLTPAVAHAIETYAANLDKARRKNLQDSEREGRKLGQYWSNLEGPKITADVLEAVVAAIFIDDGCDIDGKVKTFFTAVLQPFYDKHESYQTLAYHPAKVLYTMLHGHGCNGLTFDKEQVDIERVACNVLIHGTLIARATALRASVAVRDASASAVEAFETTLGAPQGCACRTQPENRKKQTEAIRSQLQPFADSDSDIKQMMPS